jgi:hypothetical protein
MASLGENTSRLKKVAFCLKKVMGTQTEHAHFSRQQPANPRPIRLHHETLF